MHKPTLRLTLAFAWGVCATWIFWWLFVPATGVMFAASEPAIRYLVQNNWPAEQIEGYLQGVTTVSGALIYGIIFGLPLGFFATHSIIVTWVVFVVGFTVALTVRMLLVHSALENLVSSIYFLTFMATLLFAYAGYRVRSYTSHRVSHREDT